MEMKTTVIKEYDEFHALNKKWNTLLEKNGSAAVQLTHEWISAWWKSFGTDSKMHVLMVCDEHDDIVGIAPMMEMKCCYRGVAIRKISLMANGYSPSCDVISCGEDRRKVIEAVFDYLTEKMEWDVIDINKIEGEGDTCGIILRRLKDKNLSFEIRDNIETPFIKIDTDWETFLKTRSVKFRKTLRNKINRANRQGDIRVERIKISDGANPFLDDMFDISAKSWKRELGTDLESNLQSKAFHRGLSDLFGKHAMVTLWMLKKDTKPVAFEFQLTYNGIVYPIRADYDEEFRDLSPGSVLECHILKTLFEEGGVREYYSCGHTYPYLLKWTENTKRHINVEIFSKKARSYGLHLLEYRMLPFMRKMKLNG